MKDDRSTIKPISGVEQSLTRKLEGGEVASVELIQLADGEQYILKTDSHPGRLLAEIRGLKTAETLGIPSPRLVTADFGKAIIVMTYLEGHLASKERSPEFYYSLMEIIAKLHATTLEGSHFGHFNDQHPEKTWINYLQKRFERKIKETQEKVEIPSDELEQIGLAYTHLLSTLPERHVSPQLLHGDIHFENVMVLKGGGLAIFDFCELAVGDPLYDLAILCNFEPWSEEGLLEAYPNKAVFEQGRKEWFAFYSFLHAIEIFCIYSWKNPSKKQRYWDRAMSFVQE